jgi:hypothetical protein
MKTWIWIAKITGKRTIRGIDLSSRSPRLVATWIIVLRPQRILEFLLVETLAFRLGDEISGILATIIGEVPEKKRRRRRETEDEIKENGVKVFLLPNLHDRIPRGLDSRRSHRTSAFKIISREFIRGNAVLTKGLFILGNCTLIGTSIRVLGLKWSSCRSEKKGLKT